jgi:hypothetical protein
VPGYLERNKARIVAEKAAVREYLRMRQQVRLTAAAAGALLGSRRLWVVAASTVAS